MQQERDWRFGRMRMRAAAAGGRHTASTLLVNESSVAVLRAASDAWLKVPLSRALSRGAGVANTVRLRCNADATII
ncbi:unnamed protein product [Pieris brassicae]|uniref:Uncharacterized protein n=1 Tax=Pieris brassicae TaxID=7116 RepID=A0A9P0T6U2_PIEBR|nr:unnamed protein product [Pieris brassicae]